MFRVQNLARLVNLAPIYQKYSLVPIYARHALKEAMHHCLVFQSVFLVLLEIHQTLAPPLNKIVSLAQQALIVLAGNVSFALLARIMNEQAKCQTHHVVRVILDFTLHHQGLILARPAYHAHQEHIQIN